MKALKIIALITLFVLVCGFLVPDRRTIPVAGATRSDWNANTFWFEPWGSSGVHKGIDIFATRGTPVIAATDLVLLYRGELPKGGKVVLGLGPKWRLHYFAHLDSVNQNGLFAVRGESLGTVGNSGNALGKQAHLHYSIVSLLPRPWLVDGSTQGYKKAFYLNPIEYLTD
ncbi:M23 family metallopeptidase [Marinobacter xestospongiae]|uniref:M23 family metallopeptidase n=1 Tax=Marinobacter xestospongiae TaxID=994319 RepID=UPI00200320F0|nr:M23 family metallopeptidase [Marinobacter xestospongiae]MCK7566900.1 M23 family metallopeptidase [Marinobacter xestospongiae]